MSCKKNTQSCNGIETDTMQQTVTGKMVLNKMVRTKWYGQTGTDKMVAIFL